VTILDSGVWTAITGEAMPTKPIDAAAYTAAGLPWFDYQTDQPAIEGSKLLKTVKSIAKVWTSPAVTNAFEDPVGAPNVKRLGNRQVREMRN
jgi:hypothetical protein